MYLKYSTWPPWYEVMAMPWTSSWMAHSTISETERLCPRWITSAPDACMMRRITLMAASCPSKSEAAVTMRTWWRGLYGAGASMVFTRGE